MASFRKKLIEVENGKPLPHAKLFFGEYSGVARIDTIQYPQFKKLYESSESNTWFMNEIDYSKDIIGWANLPERAQNMFNKNIGYQMLMDSGVTNIFSEIAKVCSIPELQYLYSRISIEENIHALSYSNSLDIVFGSKAQEVIDIVYNDKVVQKRMESEVDGADNFIDIVINQRRDDDEAKKSILILLGAAYLLEGIKFPFSFFVTWKINHAYDNSIQGMSRLLKLIAWDEMTVHTVTGSTVLNILRKDKEQGFSHLFEWFDEWMDGFTRKTVNEEIDWSKYLLIDGPIPGYNEEVGEKFIKYWADERLKKIKIKAIYNIKKFDDIDWYNRYRDINSTSLALQEADSVAYQKGKLTNDLDKFDLPEFESSKVEI